MTAAVSTTVRHVQSRLSPNASITQPPSDSTCMDTTDIEEYSSMSVTDTNSDSNSVFESRPTYSVDTVKSNEDEIAEVEKNAVER